MSRSFLNDNSCLQLKWKRPDYYIDIFAADFFETTCSNQEKTFHVFWDKKKPKKFPAKCLLTVKGAKAIIDCSDFNVKADPEFEGGIIEIYFFDSSRKVVKRVDWKPLGGEIIADAATTNWDMEEASEGKRYLKETEVLSRNFPLMLKRKKKDDYTCAACGYKLEVAGKFIADCHHTKPLSDNSKVRITKIDELVTLCPNCHRIAHSRAKPYSVNQIKQILKKAGVSVTIL